MRSEAEGIGDSRRARGAEPTTMLSNIETVNAGFRAPHRGVARTSRPTTGDTMADLKKAFEQAVADSKGLPEKPDNATLLKIYALYKQATAGDVDGKRPGFTDMVGRAKWDAWNELKGKASDSAMQEYVDRIESPK
jgi:diazepam-binding inhibitor (GABA receptor modulating acyl-CoA-binding protein)